MVVQNSLRCSSTATNKLGATVIGATLYDNNLLEAAVFVDHATDSKCVRVDGQRLFSTLP